MIISSPQSCHIQQLSLLWQEAFGDTDAFIDGFFRTGFSPANSRCLWIDDQVAAALYWFDCSWQGKKLAYLYAVATRKSHRGQGLCRSLLADTHRHLLKNGYHGAVLVPGSPDLAAMYKKLGYTPFRFADTTTVLADAPACPTEEISAEAYRNLRKTFLPQDAVVQKNPVYDFLATYCRFYRGKDFLLCAAREENTLYIQEYLGDKTKLPGILAALQAEKGVVRIPGNAVFAMYHALTESAEMPEYFAIALD